MKLRLRLNNRGQAVTEYTLVLVVVVGIIMGAVYEFNTAFQVWAKAYFGDYLTCLLEVGELPSIGGDPGSSGVCDQYFAPFNIANGRAAIAQGSSASSSSGNQKAPARGRGVNESASTQHRGGSGSSSDSGRDGQWSRNSQSSNHQGSSSSEDKQGINTGDLTASSSGGGSVSGRFGTGGDNGRFLDGRLGLIKPENERQKGYAAGTSRSDLGIRTPKRLKLKPPVKKELLAEDNQPFTLGSLFRFLLIAAIIILLIVVLGGQILQVSKNMEAQ